MTQCRIIGIAKVLEELAEDGSKRCLNTGNLYKSIGYHNS
jgi:hypothetical protein